MKRLDETTWVAGQIAPADIAALDVRIVVNNRPDGEEPGQPPSADIGAAARAAGLDYRDIPISGAISAAQVEAMAQALDVGPALLFCRSGTRSTWLWALARASRGADPGQLAAAAAEAGYDLGPLLPYLRGV
ncbi:MAG: hypothetical protein QOJ94_983 [Sphingomonadales bacterium]|jgi:uncharacterized protein (TIGR01244 family)|nr:hypothetical protein [Sphingomonadales bacterium]